jgi:hypothetical protein
MRYSKATAQREYFERSSAENREKETLQTSPRANRMAHWSRLLEWHR